MSGGYVCLFVGGIFNGQTYDGALPRDSRRLVLPVSEPLNAATFLQLDPDPRDFRMRTAEYDVAPERFALRYFPAWRDAQGRILRGLLLSPTVQQMGMRVQVEDGEPPKPDEHDVQEHPEMLAQWEKRRAYQEQVRDAQEHQALMAMRDSHMVNRQVSPVQRTEEPSGMPWGGVTIRYDWLAELEHHTSGVEAGHIPGLRDATSLVDRTTQLAAAIFPLGIPADLQAVLDRANARQKGSDRG